MGTTGLDLRSSQRRTLNELLEGTKVSDSVDSAPWRVLVVDEAGQHIVKALLNGAELRAHNVTHMVRVEEERANLGDVNAVYVLEPTLKNVRHILRDVDGVGSGRRSVARRYARASVGFTTCASSEVLEALASGCRLPSRVVSVHDLHADFVCADSEAFALRARVTYTDLCTADRQQRAISDTVDALYCVAATLSAVPVIRAERGGAAEKVGELLCSRLGASLSQFGRPASFRRPVLLLLDRDHDLSPALHHSWAYQPLIHDSLTVNDGNVELESTSVNGDTNRRMPVKHSYRLDKASDPFWESNASLPLPQVTTGIEEAMAEYKEDVDAINRRGTRRGNDNVEGGSKSRMTSLADAMLEMPHLIRRKERLDMHTNIASGIMEVVEKRKLNEFFDFESAVLDEAVRAGAGITRTHAELHLHALNVLLGGGPGEDTERPGTETDRARAACLFYDVLGHVIDEELLGELRTIMQDAGVSPDVLSYIRNVRRFDHNQSVTAQPKAELPNLLVETSMGWTRPSLRGTMAHVLDKGFKGVAKVAQVAQNMLAEKEALFRTARTAGLFVSERARERMAKDEVDAVLESLAYLDPKLGGLEPTPEDDVALDAWKRRRHALYEDAIVFICGGGNYLEAANVRDAADGARILYGATQLTPPQQFMHQLTQTAQQSQSNKDANVKRALV